MYAILRLGKIKSKQHLNASSRHNLRLDPVENADSEKTKFNKIGFGKSYKEIVGKMEEVFMNNSLVPRKNAVIATEAILTASPEFFHELDFESKKFKAWIQKNLEFITNEFGRDNILNIAFHLDETTPHFHVLFIPLTEDKRLSMKDRYGGKVKLKELQNRYANSMRMFHLKRGLEKEEKVKHTTVKHFYNLLNALKNLPENQKNRMIDLIEEFKKENTSLTIEKRLNSLESIILKKDYSYTDKIKTRKFKT